MTLLRIHNLCEQALICLLRGASLARSVKVEMGHYSQVEAKFYMPEHQLRRGELISSVERFFQMRNVQ